jgi:hypothetical protein
MGETQSPPYALLHDGQEIGEAARGFREALFQVQKVNRTWDPWWPDEIHDLWIDNPGDRDGQHRRRRQRRAR